jgi:hypothetical protein
MNTTRQPYDSIAQYQPPAADLGAVDDPLEALERQESQKAVKRQIADRLRKLARGLETRQEVEQWLRVVASFDGLDIIGLCECLPQAKRSYLPQSVQEAIGERVLARVRKF